MWITFCGVLGLNKFLETVSKALGRMQTNNIWGIKLLENAPERARSRKNGVLISTPDQD